MIISLYALLVGFFIDCIVGDPHIIPHPVVFIGKLITFMQNFLRKIMPKTKNSELIGGFILVITVLSVSTAIPLFILYFAGLISPYLRFIIESLMCWQILAAKSLQDESMKVYNSLKEGEIEQARYNVSMIVGRDATVLDEIGITKATVETIAENTSDGVIAPILYLALGGACLGFFYKAASTMDSMIAYKNEKYLYFGRCAAYLDDFLNLIPARLSALAMIVICPILHFNTKNAWKIWRRDNRKHESPNSAQTEATCAGALEIQLAGDAWYRGILHKKYFLGENIRPVEYDDIKRANQLMYGASILMLFICTTTKLVIIF